MFNIIECPNIMDKTSVTINHEIQSIQNKLTPEREVAIALISFLKLKHSVEMINMEGSETRETCING